MPERARAALELIFSWMWFCLCISCLCDLHFARLSCPAACAQLVGGMLAGLRGLYVRESERIVIIASRRRFCGWELVPIS